MCETIDIYLNKGKAEGRIAGVIESAIKMIKSGMSFENVCEILELKEELKTKVFEASRNI